MLNHRASTHSHNLQKSSKDTDCYST